MSHYKYLSDEALEVIARRIINSYDPSLLHTPTLIPVESILEQVYGLTLEFQCIRKNGRILGETVFENTMIPIYERRGSEGYKLIPVKAGTVIIDVSLINQRSAGRFRYTCAHELAHWVIDKNYFTELSLTAAMTRNMRSSETDMAIERQADRLACRILMPRNMVKKAYHANRNNNVIETLSDLFGVSRQAMKIRLKELKLLY